MKPIARTPFLSLLLTIMTSMLVSLPAQGSETVSKPNIILILADDLGYGDIGAFGGEIDTPNLDALADNGIRLTNFHTQASCSPARSMILSGVDNHLNGMGTMAEDLLPHHEGLPGYVGYLNHRVKTIATVLKQSGYHTYLSGKWHLGYESAQRPFARGFEKTFALLNGTAAHFDSTGANALQPKGTYTRNGEITERPQGYSSDLFTDELIKQIDGEREDGKPFFAYLSFTAPHWPLQAPAPLIEKYRDTYQSGWDRLRRTRFERMQSKKLIGPDVIYPQRLQEVPAWNSLSASEQQVEARKMAVYAAMVDNLDANIGRLVTYLKKYSLYDNSVIVFFSDNGTDPYDRSERAIYKDWIAANFDNRLENIGHQNSYTFYGPGWAQAGGVHLRHHKFLPGEGGTRTPTIVRLPSTTGGQVKREFASILDLVPTFLSMAKVTLPDDSYAQHHAPQGRSLLPWLQGKHTRVYGEDESVSFELFGHGAVYRGPWKAVKVRAPWGDSRWSLYHLENDPTESQPLNQTHPDVLKQLISDHRAYRKRNQVITEPDNATAYPNKPTYIKFQPREGLVRESR
jgi:arylsulfatase